VQALFKEIADFLSLVLVEDERFAECLGQRPAL
jgi:hypothetical protein